MATTIARFQNGKTYTIKDEAMIQHPHSGVIHVAGKVCGSYALATHSNVGSSTTFSGIFIDNKTYDTALKEINGQGRYHILEEIMQGGLC